MAKAIYGGVASIAKKIKSGYVGVGGVAKKITKGYIGDVNGIAREFWSGGKHNGIFWFTQYSFSYYPYYNPGKEITLATGETTNFSSYSFTLLKSPQVARTNNVICTTVTQKKIWWANSSGGLYYISDLSNPTVTQVSNTNPSYGFKYITAIFPYSNYIILSTALSGGSNSLISSGYYDINNGTFYNRSSNSSAYLQSTLVSTAFTINNNLYFSGYSAPQQYQYTGLLYYFNGIGTGNYTFVNYYYIKAAAVNGSRVVCYYKNANNSSWSDVGIGYLNGNSIVTTINSSTISTNLGIIYDIAYWKNTFFVYGTKGTMYSTDNGVTWQTSSNVLDSKYIDSNDTPNYTSIISTYNNNKIYVGGWRNSSKKYKYSTDGLVWTEVTIPNFTNGHMVGSIIDNPQL